MADDTLPDYSSLAVANGLTTPKETEDLPDYAGLVKDQQDKLAAHVRNNMQFAPATNPEKEAQHRHLAEFLNQPLDTVRADPETAQLQAALKATDADRLAAGAPKTAALLGDPSNARMLHDTIPNVAATEQAVQQIAAQPQRGLWDDFWVGGKGTALKILGALDRGAVALSNLMPEGTPGRMTPEEQAGYSGRSTFLTDLAQENIPQRLTGQVAAGLAYAPFGPLAAPLVVTGSEGNAREQELLKAGADPDAARLAAASEGGLQGLIQMLPLGHVLFGQGSKAILKSGAGAIAKAGAAGAAQSLISDTSTQQLLQGAGDTELAKQYSPSAEKALGSAAFMGGLHLGSQVLFGAHQGIGKNPPTPAELDVVQAEQTMPMLQKLGEIATEGKFRQLDPAAFNQFVADVVEHTGAPDVYVDARKFAEVLDQAKVDGAALAAKLPDVAGQMREALQSEGTVRIPLADYATHISGGPLDVALLPHLKTDPAGMTYEEAQSFHQEQADAMAPEAQQLADANTAPITDTKETELNQIHDQVLGQLEATGRNTPDTSKAYAALTKHMYGTIAERTGQSPTEIFTKHPLAITAEDIAGEHLDQSAYHGTPHEVDKFTTQKIGSGEGAQAYGWGMYFAGNKDIAEFYRKSVGEKQGAGEGNTYKVEIPNDGNLLDYDAKLKDQPENVRAALEKLGIPLEVFGVGKDNFNTREEARAAITSGNLNARVSRRPNTLTGKDIYEALQKGSSPEVASRALNEAGIPGLRYKDANSRGAQAESDTHNYVIFDDSHVGAPEVLNQAARGEYSPATNTITMLQGADLSTYLHELGHHFFETYARLAAEPGAPKEIVDDVKTMLTQGGVTEEPATWLARSLDERREVHENFARSFEAYLMEGKAPTLELQSMFGRFRAWLLQVYKSLSALRVQLTPEVRSVMDRMVATETEIQHAQEARSMLAMFESKPEGMTDAAYAEYLKLNLEAKEDGIRVLQYRGLRDMKWLSNAKSKALKDLQKQASTERAAIRDEVTKEYDDNPAVEAKRAMDAASVAHEKDPKSADLNAQLIAEQHGFETVDQMHLAIDALEDRKSYIEGMTDQRMLERHGDLIDSRSIERAAEAAVHNDFRARFLATELTALAKSTGSPRLLAKAAKEAADTAIAAKRVRDLRPDQYSSAEGRAGRAADKAFRKGDTHEAAIQKRAQLLSNALARSATEAAAEITKGVQYLKKFDKESIREKIDVDYRDQIDQLLAAHDLRVSISGKALDKRVSLKDFVERLQAAGQEPMVPQDLVDDANLTHYKNMSVESFRGLVDAVGSLEKLGRLKTKILDGQDARDFKAVVDEATKAMAELPQRDSETNRGLSAIDKKWVDVKSTIRSADSSLIKIEQMLDWLDNHNPDGVFNRVVFKRIADAGVRENDLLVKVVDKLKALGEAQPKGYGSDFDNKLTLPGLIDTKTGKTQILLKRELVTAMLNTGNESSYQKLLAGEKGWNEVALKRAFDTHITKADMDYVQGVWHAINDLWPEIEAMERRLGNTSPEKISPRSVETPHGTYEGGYYPAVYDPLRSFDVELNRQKSSESLFDQNNYLKATTSKGHTIERNENYARPFLLSLDVIPRHLNQVIHDIAYREAVMDADRFLMDKRIRESIENVLGREYYQQLRPWLQSIANDRVYDSKGLAFWDQAAHWTRTSTTIVGLGYRLSTMLIHGATAASNSVGEIGARWMASGVRDVLGSPEKMAAARDFIFQRSGEMRHRMNEFDRDVRDQLREMQATSEIGLVNNASNAYNTVKRSAFYGIAMLDFASAVPTWMGAYNKGLHEGLTEQQAVYAADKSVRNAHGGGGVKDLAAIQRGTEFQKLFTMFYSFWNHFYNRQRDIGRMVTQLPGKVASGNYAGARRDFAMIVARSWFYFIVPQLLHAALKPPAPGSQDEEENWAHWAAKEIGLGMFSGIPVARDLANAFSRGGDYNPTPVVSIVKNASATFKDAAGAMGGEGASDKWLSHAIQTSGYVFGLPLGQPATTAQFLWDLGDSKQDPQDLKEWWNGIAHGQAHH